jgi:transcriptional regulator with XRE-family HTH domain
MGEKIIVYFLHKLYVKGVNYMMQREQETTDIVLASIGERIQKHREQAGFTREQLAEASGLSVQSIVKIESGKRNFRILSLISIARALGLSCDYLLGLSDNDDSQNVLVLLSMLPQDGQSFIKGVIQLYLQSNLQ